MIIFDEAHRLSAVNYGSGKDGKDAELRLAEEIRLHRVLGGVVAADRHAAPGGREPQPIQEPACSAGRRRRFRRAGGRVAALSVESGGKKFTDLVIRTPKKDVTDAEGAKVFKGRQTHRLPFKMYEDEEELLQGGRRNTSATATRCWSG